MKWGIGAVFAILLGGVLLGGLMIEPNPSSDLREIVALRGAEDTGAENLVAAIYLGYRAFDTLGETVVLVLSVAGVATLLGNKD